MTADGHDDQDRPFEPTPQKLQKARERGEVARSADLSVAAAYGGLVLVALAAGAASLAHLGTTLAVLVDQPDRIAPLLFDGPAAGPAGGILLRVATAAAPWFAAPALAVLLSILAQRGLVVAPQKLAPKLSRLSIATNARNRFGRSGLFDFAKAIVKLTLYATCLGMYLRARLPAIVAVAAAEPGVAVALLARLGVEFLFLVLLIAAGIGAIDAVWQHADHRRRNRMSRKEMTDEAKEAEGDPHMKQQRRQRAQEIAMSRMMAEVPRADVVIVNPTHYAVALAWSRKPGSAPVCVAKGVDEIAATIRRIAAEAGVPVHRDPPTARALHAGTGIGQQIAEDHYRAVAAAIRFAERMRMRSRRAFR